MPPVPGAEGAFYAAPHSEEIADLNRRWAAGDFIAKIQGELRWGNDGWPVVLFVPDGQDSQLVGGLLAMYHKPPATAFLGTEVTWRQ